MARNRRPTITEGDKKQIAQQFINERIGDLNLGESYQDLLRGIFAPLYARQPIISPVDFDQFTNPMWSVYEREMSISAERNKKLKDYCFTAETEVPLLDGRVMSMLELVEEFGDGTPFYVYSYDYDTCDVTVGVAHSPRKTGHQVEVVRVAFDNGEHVDCSIDERFILRDGSEVQACNLSPGASLMPLYLHSYGDYTKYESFNSLVNGKTVATHRMVANWLFGEVPTGMHIHHQDFNSLNNSPLNLRQMTRDDHFALHSQIGSSNLTRFLHKLWSREDFRSKMKLVSSENGKKIAPYLNSDLTIRARRTAAIRESEDFRRTRINGGLAAARSEVRLAAIAASALQGASVKSRIQKVLDVLQMNNLEVYEQSYELTRSSMQGHQGYPKWPAYEHHFNHKVVSVKCLDDPRDVYDFTVDKSNFALAAGVFVHNCDMDEDSIISTALDIYASEACQYSDEHGATVWVTSQDPLVMEESHRLFQQTEYEDYLEGICRDAAKCGDDFVGALYNFRDGIVRLKFVEPDEVTIRTDKYGRLTAYRYQDSKINIEPWNFIHYKNIGKKQSAKKGGSVYGTSMLEPARREWRKLRMMEDALVIWRMDIGTRRLVFYVDVGNLGQEEAMKAIRDWERSYKKKPYFNPCLIGSTQIKRLNGERTTIRELAESGLSSFWVYSYDHKKKKIVPGLASGARKTGEKVPVWKVTYDNGLSDTATWNHQFMMRDGSYTSLGDLQVGDSLMPLYCEIADKEIALDLFGPSGYEVVRQPNGKWEYTHRMSTGSYPIGLRQRSPSRRVVRHHIDFNRFNNDPSNLRWMTWEDHDMLHKSFKTRGVSCPETDKRFNHNITVSEIRSFISAGFTPGEIADTLGCDVRTIRRRLHQVGLISELHPGRGARTQNHKNMISKARTGMKFSRSHVQSLKDAWVVRRARENHSIVSIEFFGYEDVYNFDVEIHENFATGSGVFVHNSTGEFISRHSPLALDNHIFWPIRPTSRSRVEYIGGDTNVSAVADVDYFSRKMAASLKIPMAYLGGDEYAAVRTGLAQMDVYFARCVKKLQRSMSRGTLKLLLTHLRLREVPYSQDDVRVNMEPISGIEEMQRIEALTASVNLAQMMFMTGTAMGIPPQLWVPYILKDILKIADEDILRMPIDMNQIQQVQQLQAGGPEGPGGGPGGGEEGDEAEPGQDGPPSGGKKADSFEGNRQELRQRIQEELQKGEYGNLRQFLATEADTDMSILVPESDLIPVSKGKVPRTHRSQLAH